MPAATAAEWLTATAIGTATLPPLWLVAHLANSDYQLPRVSLAPVAAAAHRTHQAAAHARLHLAAWLLTLAWRLENPRGT